MLVLTMKIGEAIVVGTDIRVLIHGVNRRQVKVGIDAPSAVPVTRGEILISAGESPTGDQEPG